MKKFLFLIISTLLPLFSSAQEPYAIFIDNGTAYNPLQQADPDVTLSAEERKIGGLGIFIVKKTMDSVTYCRNGDKNELTITKTLKNS